MVDCEIFRQECEYYNEQNWDELHYYEMEFKNIILQKKLEGVPDIPDDY